MNILIQTEGLIFVSFLAGMLSTIFLVTDWGHTYAGEKEQQINSPAEMKKYWQQYGIDVPVSTYQKWKNSLRRKV